MRTHPLAAVFAVVLFATAVKLAYLLLDPTFVALAKALA